MKKMTGGMGRKGPGMGKKQSGFSANLGKGKFGKGSKSYAEGPGKK